MRNARGQKLQSFRRKWPFCMDLYSVVRNRSLFMKGEGVGKKLGGPFQFELFDLVKRR
jgi:hypothetical protein